MSSPLLLLHMYFDLFLPHYNLFSKFYLPFFSQVLFFPHFLMWFHKTLFNFFPLSAGLEGTDEISNVFQ